MYEEQIDRVLDAVQQISPTFTDAYIRSIMWGALENMAFATIFGSVGSLLVGGLLAAAWADMHRAKEFPVGLAAKISAVLFAVFVVAIFFGNLPRLIDPEAVAAGEIVEEIF